MKLGLIARMDNSGLGQQTYEFYNHMKPDKTMVVDISVLEKLPERVIKQYPDRYPDANFIYGIPNEADIREFLKGLDVVFIAESAYNMQLYPIARQMGVKTAVQYNWEFFDWYEGSIWANNLPDLFIAPSTWHYEEVDQICKAKGVKHVYLHCPVNRTKIKKRSLNSCVNFLHIAGRPAAHDRNGTYRFLEALTISDYHLNGIVVTQDKELAKIIKQEYSSCKVIEKIENYEDIYKKGNVLVMPRKYGGNCLPMNEALSAGMPVIMPNISPQNDFLPKEWLVPAKKTDIEFAPRFPIDVYDVSAHALFLKMKWFESLSPEQFKEFNNKADELAESISWAEMEPKYREVLEALCQL